MGVLARGKLTIVKVSDEDVTTLVDDDASAEEIVVFISFSDALVSIWVSENFELTRLNSSEVNMIAQRYTSTSLNHSDSVKKRFQSR